MKKMSFAVLVCISVSISAHTLPEVSSFSPQQIFKNWVQSRCISKITQDHALIEDAKASAAAWLEYSQLPVEEFQKADVVIDTELKRKVGGSVNSSYRVLQCTLIAESESIHKIFIASQK
ncbi:T6SS amidase immunity protein Tai4 family protein [Phytobacter sp. V91]|uniref:T6SS amidase immunity protein Tai4 family protein n=1 Tax=Phytobacter sp. V91 TaxID=3369425 RepID=UPI003F5F16B1